MKKIIIFLFLIVTGCSSVSIVGVDKAPDFTITKYKTFNFFEVNMGGDALGPDTDGKLKLLKEAISKQLSLKGLSQTTESPDLLINIGVLVDEKTQTRQTDFSNPADRTAYMGQRNYSWHSQEVEVGKYRQGTVTVHLVERSASKLVWKGSADSVLPEKEKNIPALIEEGMTKLFEKVKQAHLDLFPTLKRDTVMKKICLTDDRDEVDCHVNGSSIVLRTEFLKKS